MSTTPSKVRQDGGVSAYFDCSDAEMRAIALTSAASALKGGDLVVLPTDTVYGIGADAFDPDAVAALLDAKGRGRDMPVPVLVGSWHTIDGLVSVVTAQTRDLIEAFWPGGLTLVVEQAPSLAWDLGDVNGTVAVRMPMQALAIDLLTETGPLAVSSANRSGQPPAMTAAEAQTQLGESVMVYLDDGPAAVGVPSSIVDVSGERPQLLRAGAIDIDALREVVPDLLDQHGNPA